MKKQIVTTAALALTLALTGCGSSEPEKKPEPAAAQEQERKQEPTFEAPVATPKPKPEPEPEPVEEEESVADQLAAFGETWEYEDGIAVAVEYIGPQMAGPYAAGAEPTNGQMQVFNVTIANNSGSIFDPTMAYSEVTYGPSSKIASAVFDEGLTNRSGKILPGKTQALKVAFAIPHKKTEVLFIASPDWEHEDAMYYGTIGAK